MDEGADARVQPDERDGPVRRPRLTVLAGPTAVGKGTVSADIRERYPEVWLSVSATTRPRRPGEIDGKHYWFVSPGEFDRMVAEGELIEWAVVHGVHRYGTPRRPVEEALRDGRPALLEIDLQGARQIMEEIGISESRRVRGLGANQIAALVERFNR